MDANKDKEVGTACPDAVFEITVPCVGDALPGVPGVPGCCWCDAAWPLQVGHTDRLAVRSDRAEWCIASPNTGDWRRAGAGDWMGGIRRPFAREPEKASRTLLRLSPLAQASSSPSLLCHTLPFSPPTVFCQLLSLFFCPCLALPLLLIHTHNPNPKSKPTHP